ncbi:MAG: hypothetical protein NT154_37005 [Verrucomicrobia bacterium]|nr:hypothetical protein [Verrucomicrobiota bacterium]
MPSNRDKSSQPPDIKVFIRTAQGKYLAQDDNGLFFTEDRSAAIVLNYRADLVPEQLEMIGKTHGIALTADPVPPAEIYETCDRCKELFMPFMTFFDGKQFLCADCRRPGSGRRPQI